MEKIMLEELEVDSATSSETECLFHWLWLKENVPFPRKYNFYVPDTVVYKGNNIHKWYFTSKDGQIRQKNKCNLNADSIHDEFLKRDGSILPIADTFRFMPGSNNPIQFHWGHIPKTEFRSYIYHENVKNIDILQKFVHPKECKNTAIRVSWSSNLYNTQKRANIYDLTNNKIPFIERMVTFEGPQLLSRKEVLISTSILSDIQIACEQINEHIREIAFGFGRIESMTLIFKLDKRERLALLACTNIKLKLTQTIKGFFMRHLDTRKRYTIYLLPIMKENTFSGGLRIQRKSSVPKVQPPYPASNDGVNTQAEEKKIDVGGVTLSAAAEFRTTRCPICEEYISLSSVYDVTHKTFIQIYDYFHYHNQHKTKDPIKLRGLKLQVVKDNMGKLPKVMRNLFPSMSSRKYDNNKRDVIWMYEIFKACEHCWDIIKKFLATLERLELQKEIDKLNRVIEENSYLISARKLNKDEEEEEVSNIETFNLAQKKLQAELTRSIHSVSSTSPREEATRVLVCSRPQSAYTTYQHSKAPIPRRNAQRKLVQSTGNLVEKEGAPPNPRIKEIKRCRSAVSSAPQVINYNYQGEHEHERDYIKVTDSQRIHKQRKKYKTTQNTMPLVSRGSLDPSADPLYSSRHGTHTPIYPKLYNNFSVSASAIRPPGRSASGLSKESKESILSELLGSFEGGEKISEHRKSVNNIQSESIKKRVPTKYRNYSQLRVSAVESKKINKKGESELNKLNKRKREPESELNNREEMNKPILIGGGPSRHTAKRMYSYSQSTNTVPRYDTQPTREGTPSEPYRMSWTNHFARKYNPYIREEIIHRPHSSIINGVPMKKKYMQREVLASKHKKDYSSSDYAHRTQASVNSNISNLSELITKPNFSFEEMKNIAFNADNLIQIISKIKTDVEDSNKNSNHSTQRNLSENSNANDNMVNDEKKDNIINIEHN